MKQFDLDLRFGSYALHSEEYGFLSVDLMYIVQYEPMQLVSTNTALMHLIVPFAAPP